MTLPVDIITALNRKLEDGTPAEKSLAGTILADPAAAARAPIAVLARQAGVSEPTVTRLSIALGLEGTRDLKLHLAQAVAVGGAYLTVHGEPVMLGKSRALAAITTAAHKAIDEVQATVNEDVLDRVAGKIAAADHVLTLGTGGISSVMAQELSIRLFRFGVPVTSEVDGQMQRMRAAVLRPNSVAIGLSISGRARSVIDALTLANEYGAETVAVAPLGSELARAADHVIGFHHAEDGQIYKPTSARFALLTIIDALALVTAERFGPKVVETMRRMKNGLSMTPGYDPKLPLGD